MGLFIALMVGMIFIGAEAKDKYIIADLIKSINLPVYPQEVFGIEMSGTDIENLARILRTNSLNQTEQ